MLGSREALFGFAQAIVDASRPGATVVIPNPFYQIYEGAALLAGAGTCASTPMLANGFAQDWDSVPADVWARTQLLYVCSPDNPTGRVVDRCRSGSGSSSSPIGTASRSPPTSAIRRSTSTRRGRTLSALSAAQRADASDFRAPRRLRQPVEALECARPALRLRRGRRGADQAVPALSDVSRIGDVARRRGGEHRRLERRGARRREPRASTPQKFARLQPRVAQVLPARCRRPRSTCGRARQATMRSSRGRCTPSRTSPCCRAASLRATRTAPTRGAPHPHRAGRGAGRVR